LGSSSISDELLAAGMAHPRCRAVLAVTGDDHTNLQIAISAKLLNPPVPVVARADNHSTRDNMASFATDYIVNPFDTFAGGLAMAIQKPRTHRLYEWLSARPVIPLFPSLEEPLQVGDALLFIGSRSAVGRVGWIASHPHDLRYLLTGYRPADGLLLRWWQQRRQAERATRS